jgi:hypothetical protein
MHFIMGLGLPVNVAILTHLCPSQRLSSRRRHRLGREGQGQGQGQGQGLRHVEHDADDDDGWHGWLGRRRRLRRQQGRLGRRQRLGAGTKTDVAMANPLSPQVKLGQLHVEVVGNVVSTWCIFMGNLCHPPNRRWAVRRRQGEGQGQGQGRHDGHGLVKNVSERGCLGLEQGEGCAPHFGSCQSSSQLGKYHSLGPLSPGPWGICRGASQKPSVTHEAGAVSVVLGCR